MRALLTATALLAAPLAQAQTAPAETEVTAPGPLGALAGTLIDRDAAAPLLVILPGSGPTDRNGDNRLAVAGSPYRQLALALAERGVSTVRVDKRGMFGSHAAVANPNAVTIADYAADAHAWADAMRKRTGRACVWILGHSEGGLVALQAAQVSRGICGIVLVSAAGRPLGTVMREQLRASPAPAPILSAAIAMIDALEAGRPVDPATLPAPLPAMFPEGVQKYLIDALRYDPAKLAARLNLPILIAQGDRDIQVSVADAQSLAKAAPAATLAIIPGMTHVLRTAPDKTRGASAATYADASLPVAPTLADAIAGFVTRKR